MAAKTSKESGLSNTQKQDDVASATHSKGAVGTSGSTFGKMTSGSKGADAAAGGAAAADGSTGGAAAAGGNGAAAASGPSGGAAAASGGGAAAASGSPGDAAAASGVGAAEAGSNVAETKAPEKPPQTVLELYDNGRSGGKVPQFLVQVQPFRLYIWGCQ